METLLYFLSQGLQTQADRYAESHSWFLTAPLSLQCHIMLADRSTSFFFKRYELIHGSALLSLWSSSGGHIFRHWGVSECKSHLSRWNFLLWISKSGVLLRYDGFFAGGGQRSNTLSFAYHLRLQCSASRWLYPLLERPIWRARHSQRLAAFQSVFLFTNFSSILETPKRHHAYKHHTA